MKKVLLLFAILFSLYSNLNSQADQDTTTAKFYPRSIGISATFINNFLPIENPIGFSSHYPFHFIKHQCEHRFRKHALDFNIDAILENNEDTDEISSVILLPEYKFAWGRKSPIFKNAQFYYGPEVLINPEYNYRSSLDYFSFQQTKSIDRTVGMKVFFGPMVGFEYKIGSRFSIYTEAGFYLGLNYSYRKVTETDLTTEETSELFIERTLSVSRLLRFPRAIILFYHF